MNFDLSVNVLTLFLTVIRREVLIQRLACKMEKNKILSLPIYLIIWDLWIGVYVITALRFLRLTSNFVDLVSTLSFAVTELAVPEAGSISAFQEPPCKIAGANWEKWTKSN